MRETSVVNTLFMKFSTEELRIFSPRGRKPVQIFKFILLIDGNNSSFSGVQFGSIIKTHIKCFAFLMGVGWVDNSRLRKISEAKVVSKPSE